MQTGVYRSLPFEEYLQIDAVSNSDLGQVKRSPLHYRERVGLDRSKPIVMGSLVHCGRLEPLTLAERYAVEPEYHKHHENVTAKGDRSSSRATKYVKDSQSRFAAANSDKEIVSREWFGEAIKIVTAINNCKESRHALDCNEIELTLVWEDPGTEIVCKARIDALDRGSHFCDLKTTADLEKFTRSIYSYGYHRQMAHYREGWRILTGAELVPWIVVVESSSPYCVQSAPLAEDTLNEGGRERRKLLNLIEKCRKRGDWPGPPSPKYWRIPDWAIDNEPLEVTIGGHTREV